MYSNIKIEQRIPILLKMDVFEENMEIPSDSESNDDYENSDEFSDSENDQNIAENSSDKIDP